MKVFKVKVQKNFPQGGTLGEVLSKATNLPIEKISEAAQKGAVWLQRNGKGKILREREVATRLKPEDLVTLNYDERILSQKIKIEPTEIATTKNYSVWYKPAGMITQGSEVGDHTSLLRFVELKYKKVPFLIHRLDRETAGLVIIGLTSEGAAKLSALFQENKIQKIYQAVVLGRMKKGLTQTINISLDGKESITHFEVLEEFEESCLVRVELETGRLHQIRRHMDFIGHPVMGDPKYGKGNKNRTGLKLLAKALSFVDPWDKSPKNYECVENLDRL